MRPQVYWLEQPSLAGRLAIMPRPRAGEWLVDEIIGLRAEGINVVVSLLEPEEVHELGLQHEAELCRQHGMEFASFPVADRGVPASFSASAALARKIAAAIVEGKAVAVHCRAGIGRSTVIAACAMICLGSSADDALATIAKARGVAVPDTDEQRDWCRSFQMAAGARLPSNVPSCPGSAWHQPDKSA